ncbi:NADH:flavin oxidoreductase [Catelliglobosispora koreensis]|uniref:NADH:flavin oxidoreductase n=1 Tax=Catelliglobosispora koreensis TaxID=129052 RepID=UPI0003740B99|nr:NADH:flavin oxidoreductase [Catelliglobosispora koreensis]
MVFEPARLGPLTLRNRLIKSATFEGRTPEALVTDDLIAFHRSMAAGGVGMTTVAYCAVSPEGRTDRRQIWMRPEAVPGLKRLAEAVHAEGAAISAQIGHAGPVANPASNGLPSLGPGWRINPLGPGMTRRVSALDIDRIVRAHATAALLAEEAGFDAVEIHMGHGYLLSAFLSPQLNRRRDPFGGTLDNRARFAREVAAAVYSAVGGRLAVTAKFNMTDGVRAGLVPTESLAVARLLEADGTLDALQLTAGSSLQNPMYLFRGGAPVKEFAATFAAPLRWGIRLAGSRFLREYPYRDLYLLDKALEFRAALKLPLILLGGVSGWDDMETARRNGFDFVALGRALLMEPDLPNRIQADRSVRSQCIRCNRCMPTIYTRTRCVITT